MACKCHDTGAKVCRVEFSTPSSHNTNMKALARLDRKATRIALHRAMIEEDLFDDEGPLITFEPEEVFLSFWEEYGLYDHGCMCRRCLIHDDPGGCIA